MVNKNKAFFFDRDGVLNKSIITNSKPFAPKSLNDFIIYDEALDVLNYIKSKNYFIFVVTNQPDVGNGFTSKFLVEKMHKKLLKILPIDRIYVCYHSQKDKCNCRKPKLGMFYQAKKDFFFDTKKSFLVGDRFSDIEAGKKFKLKTILIGKGYSEKPTLKPDYGILSLVDLKTIV